MNKALLLLAFISIVGVGLYLISYRAQSKLLDLSTKKRTENALDLREFSGQFNSSGDRLKMLEDLQDTLREQGFVRKLPSVIGIGVKKCGTGALALFLDQHPLIEVPLKPETYFFNSVYSKGLRYYRYMMPKVKESQFAMEKTPSYFYNIKTVPHRIRKDHPNVKLVLSLCNPVARAFSDYVHNHIQNHGDKGGDLANSFNQASDHFLSVNKNVNKSEMYEKRCLPGDIGCVFSMGIYHVFLQHWMQVFNKSQLLVLNGDEWITNPGKLIEKIQNFLDLPLLLRKKDFVKSRENGFFCFRRWWDAKFTEHEKRKGSVTVGSDGKEIFCLSRNKGRTRNGVRRMQNNTLLNLEQFYRPHNEKLYDVIGENFDW